MLLRNLARAVGLGMLGFFSSVVFATPASANLTVCNRAGSKAFVAIRALLILWCKIDQQIQLE